VEQATWEPEENFIDGRGREMLEEYKQRKKLDTYASLPPVLDERRIRQSSEAEGGSMPTAARNEAPLQGRKTTRRATPRPSQTVRRKGRQVVIDGDDDSEGGGV